MYKCPAILMATVFAAIGNQTLLNSPVPLTHPCRLGNLGTQGRLGYAVYLDYSKIVRKHTTIVNLSGMLHLALS